MVWGIFIVLLILKLTATVDWSWWIITLPLWLPLATFAFAAMVWLLAALGIINRRKKIHKILRDRLNRF